MSLQDIYSGLKWCYDHGQKLKADEAEAGRVTDFVHNFISPILKRLADQGKLSPEQPAAARVLEATAKLRGLLEAIGTEDVVKAFFCAGSPKVQLQAAMVRRPPRPSRTHPARDSLTWSVPPPRSLRPSSTCARRS